MRLAYDSANSLTIPETAQVVLGYVTGKFTWSNADWNRFPKAQKLRIDATGGLPLASDILDVEPGNLGVSVVTDDMTAAQVEAIWAELCARAKIWVAARHAHGMGSTCYIEASRKNQLAQELESLPVVFLMASWGISQQAAEELIRGAEIGVQFHTEPGYDVSVISDAWFPTPVETPPARRLTGAVMTADFTTANPSLTAVLTYSNGDKETEKFS